MVDVPESELKALVPKLAVDEVLHIAIRWMQAYLGAIEFDSRLMGWDPDDVARQRSAFSFSESLVSRRDSGFTSRNCINDDGGSSSMTCFENEFKLENTLK